MYYIRVCFSIIWGIYCKLYILYLVFDFLCTRISLCTVTCNTLSYLLHYCYPPLTYLAWSKNRSLPQIFRFVRKEIFSPLNSPHRMRWEGHKPLKSSEWWLFYFNLSFLILGCWFLSCLSIIWFVMSYLLYIWLKLLIGLLLFNVLIDWLNDCLLWLTAKLSVYYWLFELTYHE